MSGLLLEKPFPGATTAIAIGEFDAESARPLASFRRILWCTRPAPHAPAPPSPFDSRAQLFPLDQSSTASPPPPTGAIEAFLRHDPRHLPSLFVSRSVTGPDASLYQPFLDETHRLLELHHRARVTRQQDGFTWQKHLLANLPAYLERRLPPEWENTLAGLPAFIVGAGPSLDVSAAKLAAAASHGVIFSADSALRALARHGLTADFAVSIDAAKIPEKCLPAGGPLPHHVVLAGVSPPAWQHAMPRERLHFVSSHQITEDWITSLGVPRPHVAATENCGATALELARWLGCDPVYLFGLDLAVAEENQTQRHHRDADASLYKNSNYDATARLPRVPGNYAGTVPCFALGDWRALDERLAMRTAPRVFNVTDRGARFRGSTLIHPDAFITPITSRQKASALNRLTREPLAIAPQIPARIEETKRRIAVQLPVIQTALACGGPPAVAAAFRAVATDPELSRFLGAYALKLMPHLVPPIEGDRRFWQTQIDELAELVR